MLPINFPEATKVLGDNGYRSEAVTDIRSLPVWSDGEQCISLWQMSWRERISALFFGRIWVHVLSGSKQPPIALSTDRNIFVVK